MLEPTTIILILCASLLHASWHSLVKSSADQIVLLAGMGLVATLIAALATPWLALPSPRAWLVIAGSVTLHVGYKVALARSYALGELGQAFPLARGLVPLFSTVIAFLFLGQLPSFGQNLGIGLVSAGLLWLATHSVHGGIDHRIWLNTIAAGLAVAGYSVVDAYGARIDGDWASFTAWLVICDSLTFAGLIYAIEGNRLWAAMRRNRTRIAVSGILGMTSFGVLIWALSRSPVGPVAALRESSVLFATLIGVIVLGENRSPHRIAAAAIITIGLAVIALSR